MSRLRYQNQKTRDQTTIPRRYTSCFNELVNVIDGFFVFPTVRCAYRPSPPKKDTRETHYFISTYFDQSSSNCSHSPLSLLNCGEYITEKVCRELSGLHTSASPVCSVSLGGSWQSPDHIPKVPLCGPNQWFPEASSNLPAVSGPIEEPGPSYGTNKCVLLEFWYAKPPSGKQNMLQA